jgi:putative transposase
MQVSTSAYYAWAKQPETTEKTKENEKVEIKIRQIFDEFKQTYSARRLAGELNKAGLKV